MAGYLLPVSGIKYKSHFKKTLKRITMKKFGFLALALGLLVAACNSGGTTSEGDSTGIDTSINSAVPETAPVDSLAAPVDSLAAPIDSAAAAQ